MELRVDVDKHQVVKYCDESTARIILKVWLPDQLLHCYIDRIEAPSVCDLACRSMDLIAIASLKRPVRLTRSTI